MKATLSQCVWAAERKKDSKMQTLFHRLRARRRHGHRGGGGLDAHRRLQHDRHRHVFPRTSVPIIPSVAPSPLRLVAKLQGLGYEVEIKLRAV